MKRFKKTDGFTLVELVIVIAVIGILGGAGTAGYKGYIQKTAEAADKVLLGTINTAFATACTENNLRIADVNAATIRLVDGKFDQVSEFSASDAKITASMIENSFEKFYTGNMESAFKDKNAKGLYWNKDEASFTVSVSTVPARVSLGNGNDVIISPEDLEALAASGVMDMGYDGIVDTMGRINDSSETLVSLLGMNESYFSKLSSAMVYFGLMDQNEANEIAKGLKGESAVYTKTEARNRATNALTLCAAMGVADPENTPESLMSMNFGSNGTDLISAYSTYGGAAATAGMALQYSVASAYAAANPNAKVKVDYKIFTYDVTVNELLNGANGAAEIGCALYRKDPAAVMYAIQNATANGGSISYADYVANGDYTNDVAGMSAALSILGGNVNKDDVDGVINVTGDGGFLDQGMSSADTAELINKVLDAAAQNNTSAD